MSNVYQLFTLIEPPNALDIPPLPKPRAARKLAPVVESTICDHRQLDMWPARAVRIARSWLERREAQS